MPVMSAIEGAFCRSARWRFLARRKVLPWALDGHLLSGDVLDIGGGGGAMGAGVVRRFPDVRLTVTDVDTDMLDAARSRLSSYGNITVEVADVTALPFADASFDAVTSYLMLHHVINWRDALAETARVLRPGGAVIGYDLTATRIARWVHQADGSPHRIITADEAGRRIGPRRLHRDHGPPVVRRSSHAVPRPQASKRPSRCRLSLSATPAT